MSKGPYGVHGQGVSRYWEIERIWQRAESRPIETLNISAIKGSDQVTWFSPGQQPAERLLNTAAALTTQIGLIR